MEIRDYNGDGPWSAEQIAERYGRYAAGFAVARPRVLVPSVLENADVRWIYPLMEQVIEGIDEHDVACAQIGVELIEEDQRFPFGAILKAKTARALGRCGCLTAEQIDRI